MHIVKKQQQQKKTTARKALQDFINALLRTKKIFCLFQIFQSLMD